MTSLRSLQALSIEALESDRRGLSITLEQVRSQGVGEAEMDLSQMKKQYAMLRFEEIRRSWKLDFLFGFFGIFGFLSLVVPWIRTLSLSKRNKKDIKVDPSLARAIREASPKEEYVDEVEFQRRIQDGFQSRDEAVKWILSDPLLTCDYCGGNLSSTFLGEQEALQLITFYKKVPAGAKDLRLVLGSYWFTRAASELVCKKCGRVIKR